MTPKTDCFSAIFRCKVNLFTLGIFQQLYLYRYFTNTIGLILCKFLFLVQPHNSSVVFKKYDFNTFQNINCWIFSRGYLWKGFHLIGSQREGQAVSSHSGSKCFLWIFWYFGPISHINRKLGNILRQILFKELSSNNSLQIFYKAGIRFPDENIINLTFESTDVSDKMIFMLAEEWVGYNQFNKDCEFQHPLAFSVSFSKPMDTFMCSCTWTNTSIPIPTRNQNLLNRGSLCNTHQIVISGFFFNVFLSGLRSIY